jgi:hypothetical protein
MRKRSNIHWTRFSEIILNYSRYPTETGKQDNFHIIMCKLRDFLQKNMMSSFLEWKFYFRNDCLRMPYKPSRTKPSRCITDLVYETLSCLHLIGRNNLQTLEEMTKIWLLLPWRKEPPSNAVFDETSTYEQICVRAPFPRLLKLF